MDYKKINGASLRGSAPAPIPLEYSIRNHFKVFLDLNT